MADSSQNYEACVISRCYFSIMRTVQFYWINFFPIIMVCFFISVQVALILSISSLIAAENALVIITIWKDPFKQLKGTPANILILNLAISDLLMGIAVWPLNCLLNWYSRESLLRAALSTGHLAYGASCLTILSLAVERLIVITYPLRSADYLTSSYLIPGIITSIWFFACLSALRPIISLNSYCSYVTYVTDDSFGILVIILILACYTKIYFIVRGMLHRDITRDPTPEEWQPEKQYLLESARRIEKLKRKEKSVACTVFIIVVIYIVCWVPVYALRNLNKSCNRYNLQFAADLFLLLHPILNPLAYSLCTKKFQRALWRIYQGLCHHGNNETPESTRFPCGTIVPAKPRIVEFSF